MYDFVLTIDSGTHSVLFNAEGSENELVAQTVAARDLSGWDLNETGWPTKTKAAFTAILPGKQ